MIERNWLTIPNEIWLWDKNKYSISVTGNISNVSETDQTNKKQAKSILKPSLEFLIDNHMILFTEKKITSPNKFDFK